MSQMTSTEQAVQEGKQAREARKPRSDNCYPEGPLRSCWNEGWDDEDGRRRRVRAQALATLLELEGGSQRGLSDAALHLYESVLAALGLVTTIASSHAGERNATCAKLINAAIEFTAEADTTLFQEE